MNPTAQKLRDLALAYTRDAERFTNVDALNDGIDWTIVYNTVAGELARLAENFDPDTEPQPTPGSVTSDPTPLQFDPPRYDRAGHADLPGQLAIEEAP